jgi:thiamine-monophosphate kinase
VATPDHHPQGLQDHQSCNFGAGQLGHTHAGPGETLADLGEWEVIRRLGAFAPPGQFADDAALLDPLTPGGGVDGARVATDSGASGGALVVNTDVLVEGIHFSDATTGPADVGWRAAAANLSDLAAMGCTEVVGITVGLVAPHRTAWSWVEGVYSGLRETLGTYGGVLLGGDCSGGGQRMLAITAIGRLGVAPPLARAAQAGENLQTPPDRGPWGAIRRGDGRPGDALVCTGPHGLSRLGLALLLGEVPAEPPGAPLPDPGLRQRAIAAHQRPRPRFDAVRALTRSRPGAMAWRVAGCDSSDGLAAAVAAIAAGSGCTAQLDWARLPLEPAMAALPQAEAWCLGGGEDFELVLALEPGWATALVGALPGASLVGELVEGEAGVLRWRGGGAIEPTLSGYRHFG